MSEDKAAHEDDLIAGYPLEWMAAEYKAGLITLECYVLDGIRGQWMINDSDGPRVVGGLSPEILASRIGKKPEDIYEAIGLLQEKGFI